MIRRFALAMGLALALAGSAIAADKPPPRRKKPRRRKPAAAAKTAS